MFKYYQRLGGFAPQTPLTDFTALTPSNGWEGMSCFVPSRPYGLLALWTVPHPPYDFNTCNKLSLTLLFKDRLMGER